MAATRLAVELLAMIERPPHAAITKTLEGFESISFNDIDLFHSYFFYRAETQVFKSKFDAWDDVLAVDFTRTADNVAKKGADMKVGRNSMKICSLSGFLFRKFFKKMK